MDLWAILGLIFVKFVNSNAKDTLVFVNALWRHGDRAPLITIPTDPNKDYPWAGLMQPLPQGLKQSYTLGTLLRKRYVEEIPFLSPKFKCTEHEIRSTDTDRTLITAMTTMLGMYHNGEPRDGYPNAEGWPLGYIPIPVHTVTFNGDPLLWAYCERRKNLSLLIWETPEFKRFWDKHHTFIEKLGNLTGLKMVYEDAHEKSTMLFKIWDCLNSEKIVGLKLPKWAEENIEYIIEACMEWMPIWGGQGIKPYRGIDIETEMARLQGGNFLWQTIDRFQKKVECIKFNSTWGDCDYYAKLRFYAFSAHDTTISIQFSTFGWPTINYKENTVPESSACLLLELWKKDDNSFYVKAYYLRLGHGIQEITNEIVGCEHGCTFEQFKERSLEYKPVPNREEACKVPLVLENVVNEKEDR